MTEQANIVYAVARPTYFVTQRGALVVNAEPVTINNFHQRQGDPGLNRMVYVILQNITSGGTTPFVVMDENNAQCLYVPHYTQANGNIPPIFTDAKLKLAAIAGFGDTFYQAMIFYERPLTR